MEKSLRESSVEYHKRRSRSESRSSSFSRSPSIRRRRRHHRKSKSSNHRSGCHSRRRRSRSRSRCRSHRSRSRSRSASSYRRTRYYGSRENPNKSRVIGVFGLPPTTNEAKLMEVFEPFGAIEHVQIIYDSKTGNSRGFGFIYYKDIEQASKARRESNGMELEGRIIRVAYSITKRAHTPTPGVYMGPRHSKDRRRSRSFQSRSRNRKCHSRARQANSNSRSRSR